MQIQRAHGGSYGAGNPQSAIRNRKSKGAFTLIELMVVIIILAVLAALIIPRVTGRQEDAKRAQTQTNISELETALRLFRVDCDRYPTTEEGLEALRSNPDIKGWREPYTEKAIPPDAWGNEFNYESDGETYSIVSFGKDGVEGGEGNDSDLYGGDQPE